MTAFTVSLSPQQQAIVSAVQNGSTGSIFGEALAGTGKTTTALIAANEMRGSVAVMAFNKAAAVEFVNKAKKLGLTFDNRVRFGTCHSFGYGGWRRVYPKVKAGPEAARTKADMTVAKFRSIKSPLRLDSFTLKLVSLAKQRALGLFGDVGDRSEWYKIVDHFDLAYELEADDGAEGEGDEGVTIEAGIELAIRTLKYHRELAPTIIDFDDMIYMPVVSGIKLWQNDWIIGDEWQDANAARRALARKMLRPGGRALFIGDRNQAIYGWAGADNDSIDTTIREFNCSELPLTVTYRCPKAVVAEANAIVPELEAHASAPEGAVLDVEYREFLKPDYLKQLRPDDAILCRNTKPLVDTAFYLLRAGVACHVEGRDIGAGLIKLVNRFPVKTLEALRDRMTEWAEKETAKLVAKGRETQAEALQDRVDTILVIMDSQPPATTVEELRSRVRAMFLDSADEIKPTLTLATVHRSKGREWPRVFILGRTEFMPSRWARQDWQRKQEQNLIYVAITRAQSELINIHGVGIPKQGD